MHEWLTKIDLTAQQRGEHPMLVLAKQKLGENESLQTHLHNDDARLGSIQHQIWQLHKIIPHNNPMYDPRWNVKH